MSKATRVSPPPPWLPRLNRPIYVGVLAFKGSTGDSKRRAGDNVLRTLAPQLRIVDEALERRVRDRQATSRATVSRTERGQLSGQPEPSIISKHLCNSIARCHVCGGPLMFVNKGGRHRPAYYCSNRIRRGNAVCSNTRGALLEALDHAVTVKLADMLNKDFEAVLDLCEQQAAVWRQQRAIPKDQRAQLEREAKRLEGAITRLLDQIEAGQAVGARLKQRQEELDIVKAKLDAADMPDLDRKGLADLLQPYGPLVGLGIGDPAVIRQVLRRIGVNRIVVTPEGTGWRFEGTANFSGLVYKRSSRPPPDSPHRSPTAVPPRIDCAGEAGARTGYGEPSRRGAHSSASGSELSLPGRRGASTPSSRASPSGR